MNLELLMAGAILGSLSFYLLLGGADYGAGVWFWLGRGSQGKTQRDLITRAIGPIWEANHVWLILAVTLLFTAFPRAFAAIGIALHIPLTLMLIGIVLRGSAFAFRSFDVKHAPIHPLWERLFAGSSVLTPLLVGITVGAVASGKIALHGGSIWAVFVRPWLAPFPIAIGFLTLALFAFLAAIYLAVEAEDHALRQEFGRRAMLSAMAVGALAMLALVLAKRGAPLIWGSFVQSTWAWVLLPFTALLAIAGFACLRAGRFRWARLCAGGQGLLMLWGWALAQYPFLVPPEMTIYNSAAPPLTLRLLLIALIVGAMLLFPSLYYLFRIFKDRPLFGR